MNTELELEEMNERLYNAAMHLAEASKYLSDLDRNTALRFMKTADKLLSVIEPLPEKIKEEKISSILDEIFNLGDE